MRITRIGLRSVARRPRGNMGSRATTSGRSVSGLCARARRASRASDPRTVSLFAVSGSRSAARRRASSSRASTTGFRSTASTRAPALASSQASSPSPAVASKIRGRSGSPRRTPIALKKGVESLRPAGLEVSMASRSAATGWPPESGWPGSTTRRPRRPSASKARCSGCGSRNFFASGSPSRAARASAAGRLARPSNATATALTPPLRPAAGRSARGSSGCPSAGGRGRTCRRESHRRAPSGRRSCASGARGA